MPFRSILFTASALLAAGGARAADLAAGKGLAQPCGACHGEQGVSQLENVPSLAGQPDQFTQWQLVYFRSSTRKDPTMEPIASALSDADIRNLGAYYASLPPPKAAPDSDPQPALTQEGAKLIARQNCASCHGDGFAGQQATARLAYQREEYLLKSLRDFKSGERRGGGVAAMPTVAYGLTDEQMAALAHYLARLPQP